jgi:hypothetical protein
MNRRGTFSWLIAALLATTGAGELSPTEAAGKVDATFEFTTRTAGAATGLYIRMFFRRADDRTVKPPPLGGRRVASRVPSKPA